MSFLKQLAEMSRRGAVQREVEFLRRGLQDPRGPQVWATTWALLRNDLAPRVAQAVLDGRVGDARVLASRWARAAERAKVAQAEAMRREEKVREYNERQRCRTRS